MKKNYLLLFCLGLSMISLSSCRQFDESKKQKQARQRREKQLQRQREEHRMMEFKKQLAHSKETAKYYEEEFSKLSGRLKDMQSDYGNVVNKLNSLQQRLNNNQQKNKVVEKEIHVLKQEIAAEREARKKDINQLLDQVARQTATAINKIAVAQQQQKAASRSNKGIPVGNGEFLVHKVGKGQTLSAIAAAYKVSVKEIKRANRLKNNVIRINQKLYIPKK